MIIQQKYYVLLWKQINVKLLLVLETEQIIARITLSDLKYLILLLPHTTFHGEKVGAMALSAPSSFAGPGNVIVWWKWPIEKIWGALIS